MESKQSGAAAGRRGGEGTRRRGDAAAEGRGDALLLRLCNIDQDIEGTVGSDYLALADTLMIWTCRAPVLGWMTTDFFGLGCLVFIWRIIDRRPRLVIDGERVLDRTLGVGKIAWSNIDGAYVRSVEGNDFICLIVRDPSMCP